MVGEADVGSAALYRRFSLYSRKHMVTLILADL